MSTQNAHSLHVSEAVRGHLAEHIFSEYRVLCKNPTWTLWLGYTCLFPLTLLARPRGDSFLDHVVQDSHLLTFGISALPALGQFPTRGSGSASAVWRSHRGGKQTQEFGAAEHGWAVL